MDNQERRQQKRFSLDLQVKISAASTTGKDIFHEETIAANISSGGVFIVTDRKLPIASKVHLEFLLAFADLKKLHFILSVESLRACNGKHVWVKASGLVIRTEEKGIGIVFDTDYQISPMQPSDSSYPVPES
jgi:c-di-GMP-binding flagellar brake protein YcgR